MLLTSFAINRLVPTTHLALFTAASGTERRGPSTQNLTNGARDRESGWSGYEGSPITQGPAARHALGRRCDPFDVGAAESCGLPPRR